MILRTRKLKDEFCSNQPCSKDKWFEGISCRPLVSGRSRPGWSHDQIYQGWNECLKTGSGSGLYSGGLTLEHSTEVRCDDHTGIFTCDGCARDPYFYVPAETQSYVIKLSCSRKVLAASRDWTRNLWVTTISSQPRYPLRQQDTCETSGLFVHRRSRILSFLVKSFWIWTRPEELITEIIFSLICLFRECTL